jgi:hypothetical protein
LHPGRCDSTVILLLSTQSSFREEVQITESLQEVLECYSVKSMEKATNAIQMFDSKSHDCWVWTFATFSVRTKYSLSPSTSLFFCLVLVEQMKKIYQELKHKGCTQSWDHRDQNKSMKNNRNSATDEAI